MRVPRALRGGARLVWRHLTTLVWLNLLWVLLAWTAVLTGPATLTTYELIAALREDRPAALRRYPALLRRNLLPGTLWLLSTALFAFVLYSNLVFWRRRLGPFGDAAVSLLGVYLAWLFAALQPYVLEGLSVERLPLGRAWRAALRAVVRSPLSAHLFVVVPAAGGLLALLTNTFTLLVLVSLVLAFAATQVRPLVDRDGPPEPSGEHPDAAPST
ncbi:hypothetical protein LAJ19_13880 (plasmid) [Deinococcus taeanensis]|uniref:DUF624 domain-containing protein n=1 Tax=Deinococcus taeanensis TaxID=2737050 RepID=UPI001CDCEC96|nr:DUF624 domain-containing protein [Deinococcus taeanensis]UBV44262.1 hypothetical protein LAJ19_13880 [Deinococcus taeanensis]